MTEPVDAIRRFIDAYNERCQPFRWTKDTDEILEHATPSKDLIQTTLAKESDVKIGDLAARTGVAPRLLRYYEEVGILHPSRSSNGYRTYGEPAIDRVLQIRELLEAGLTTEMIREALPCLEAAKEETKAPVCPTEKDLDGLRRQLRSIERRIDVLQRNRHALKKYLRAWEDAITATPAASDGVPAPVAE